MIISKVLSLGRLNKRQQEFFASKALYTAYGGARGGGKSHAVRIKAIVGALKWQGIKILILRRTYPELWNSLISPALETVPDDLAKYSASRQCLSFFNGSVIKFGNYNFGSSHNPYQGQEFDWIFIDEATHFTESEFRTLGGCLRGVNDIPKQFFLTCNPGGVGHQWVKRLFIERNYKTGCENPEENEVPSEYAFIPATVEDNVHLMNSPGGKYYLRMLSALPENIRAAHRYGDWDVLGGQFFPEFRPEKHIISGFSPSSSHCLYRALDYGLDMLACYWVAVDRDGRSYVYRELCRPGLVVSQAAAEIKRLTPPSEKIDITFAPPDIWSTQKDTGKTMAELFAQNGVPLVRAGNNRSQGWLQLKELLKDFPDGRPGMLFSKDCSKICDDLTALQTDINNPNDCAKIPHDITHSPDAIRYFAQSRFLPPEPPSRQPVMDDDGEEDYDSFMVGGLPGAGYY